MRRRGGFTLIEIMVVVVIIALLASMGIGLYMERLKDARITLTKAAIKETVDALDMYKMKNAKYPDKLDELLGGFLKANPVDSWGHPLVYRKGGGSGRKFEVGSLGGDNQPGGTDEDADIWSYDLNAGFGK